MLPARRYFDSTSLEIFAMTSDKINLYQSSGSPNSRRVCIFLAEKRLSPISVGRARCRKPPASSKTPAVPEFQMILGGCRWRFHHREMSDARHQPHIAVRKQRAQRLGA